jgi:mono/diheme cytochrome c family protein
VDIMKTAIFGTTILALAILAGGCATAPEPTATSPATAADRGREVYDRIVEIGGQGEACSNCHRLDSGQTSGPSFVGLAARAEGQSGDLSAEDYLRQSIIDPSASIVEGSFIFKMPEGYGDVLTTEEIDDLIAFMMTQ